MSSSEDWTNSTDSEACTPKHEQNLEVFFAYPGAIYPFPAGGGFRKAIMGMFYNCQLKLLSVASFGFSELNHKLENGCGGSSGCQCSNPKPNTAGQSSNGSDTAKSEFRIYSKMINKESLRVKLGDFWDGDIDSVWLNCGLRFLCYNYFEQLL